jgi:hypothetical protein
MSSGPKKKSFLKSHGPFDMKNGFFSYYTEKKSLFAVKTTLWTK